MPKKILLLLLFVLFIPSIETNAADYVLKNGKKQAGTYAGAEENAYHYYKVVPSKDGFIEITVNTSDEKPLFIDICDKEKNVTASKIKIEHKKTVWHKVKKKKVYYIRVKGTEGNTYKIKYTMKTLDPLKYAKKYNYTFTNASFYNKKENITFKVKSSIHGNMNFMSYTDSPISVQYLNSKKKVISNTKIMRKNSLSGIGVRTDKYYYICIWNANKSKEGTTTFQNMKYQIDGVTVLSNKSRGSAYTLSKNVYKEALVPADYASTYWYKVKLPKDQDMTVYVESRILQMNGSCLQLNLYNRDGKKITSKAIKMDEESYAVYKKKKYKMNYPVKSITAKKLPSDTYYISITSKSKKTSGSFRIKWN